jgi:hypothetical protein
MIYKILSRKLKIEQHEAIGFFYRRLKLKATDSGQKYSDASKTASDYPFSAINLFLQTSPNRIDLP